MDRTLLYDFLNTASVSGNEEANQEIALAYGRSFAHRQETDAVGNAVSIVNPDADCRVLLCAHMDEIGFRVTHITDEGLIQVQEAGSVKPALYLGAPMQILHERTEGDRVVREKVCGVGVFSEDLLKNKELETSDLLIDIGAESKEEAAAVVSVGDSVCADSSVRTLLNDRITARALDDKTGAFVVLEAAKKAAEAGAACGIYAQTSVGEESTGRGVLFHGERFKPTCAIIVDVTWASDSPEREPAETGEVKLGSGPVLCHSGVANKKLNALLLKIAAELGIPVQQEVAAEWTHSDADEMISRGVPTALVSIPLRYMHSCVEIADWKDLKNSIDLIAAFLQHIRADFDFRPIVP